jgi:hypothetical protein
MNKELIPYIFAYGLTAGGIVLTISCMGWALHYRTRKLSELEQLLSDSIAQMEDANAQKNERYNELNDALTRIQKLEYKKRIAIDWKELRKVQSICVKYGLMEENQCL